MHLLRKYSLYIAIFICLTFFAAYSVLSIVRHNHYESFGYDLGINDQTVWRYSNFELPLTTIAPYPDRTKLTEHVELIYALIAPFYWIWATRKMLLLLEAGFVCASGIAIFLLARKKDLSEPISLALVIGYLGFYGVQNAMWFDVHSASFATAFVAWFIYFVEDKKKLLSYVFLTLAITAKENTGLITFLISLVYFIRRKDKTSAIQMAISIGYVLFIFYFYFPHIVHLPYLYQNTAGLLSDLNPLSLIDTNEKITTIIYSFASFGFLPLLSPLSLLPILGHFGTLFVVASDLPGAQGTFGQYGTMLTPLLSWSTILTINKFKKLNILPVAILLLVSTLFVQYSLHLPLSYLTKQWFWQEPSGVKNINALIVADLPKDASVVAQNNIVPHISHRDKIYSLYPEKRTFTKASPCGQKDCDWFRWYGSPEFLLVDTSLEWDARHLLIDRQQFIDGITNLEKTGVIKKYKQIGTASLYKVTINPDNYK